MLRHEFIKQKPFMKGVSNNLIHSISRDSINDYIVYMANSYLDDLNKFYGIMFQKAYDKKQRMIDYYTEQKGDVFKLNKDNYYNQSVSDIVKKVFEQHKIIQDGEKLIQQVDLIYLIAPTIKEKMIS